MGMPRAVHVLAFAPVLAVLSVAGCAASPKAADAPASEEPTQARSYGQQAGYAQPMPGQYPQAPGGMLWPSFNEPPASDVAGAQGQLDRAEQALGLALGLRETPVPGGGDAGLAGRSEVPPQATATGSAAAPSAAPMTQADPCLIACAALASMKRSADHICTMAGEKDAACDGARGRAQRAQERVTQACPACASK